MILWTIQEVEVYQGIEETGVYRCDPSRMPIPEFQKEYDWLVTQMEIRIGPPPAGVTPLDNDWMIRGSSIQATF